MMCERQKLSEATVHQDFEQISTRNSCNHTLHDVDSSVFSDGRIAGSTYWVSQSRLSYVYEGHKQALRPHSKSLRAEFIQVAREFAVFRKLQRYRALP